MFRRCSLKRHNCHRYREAWAFFLIQLPQKQSYAQSAKVAAETAQEIASIVPRLKN